MGHHSSKGYIEPRTDNRIVKRAIRALMSPAYQKARSRNSILPEVHDRPSAENTFKLLPLSLLALRVSKVDPEQGHEGHNHAKPKRVKGLWTVRIEQHQEANDDCYYIWLYEGSQWKQKLYAVGALVAVIAVVLFPLWPLFLRQGVWYLSMGMLGLIGLFFAMAIFRLILFIITMFAAPPGLWLYPNLFEDVGFFDSFRPVWAWQEVCFPLHLLISSPGFHQVSCGTNVFPDSGRYQKQEARKERKEGSQSGSKSSCQRQTRENQEGRRISHSRACDSSHKRRFSSEANRIRSRIIVRRRYTPPAARYSGGGR